MGWKDKKKWEGKKWWGPRGPKRGYGKGQRPAGPLIRFASIMDDSYSKEPRNRHGLMRTFSWWDLTVSPRIARNARPSRLKNGTLYVHTISAAWAQELSFIEEDLLRTIQKKVPGAGVARLRIQSGPMPPPPTEPDPGPPPVQALPLSALPANLARGLAQLGDDDVRDAVSRALRTCLAPRKAAQRGPEDREIRLIPEDVRKARERARIGARKDLKGGK